MIDRATKDKIFEAAQILDVVSDFVALKKAGANYKGLCPFHDDRTPSFIVSPAKNYCKCFACGKGGSPVGFIMEHEQLSFPDALRYLAKKYGIPVEERQLTPEERAAQTEKESMYILNEWAMDWFKKQMMETDEGKDIGLAYFRGRGFRDDIIEKFQLGFCPTGWDTMTNAALKAGYQKKFLGETGLSVIKEDGKIYDRYRGRVMFPWFTVGGKVSGFGGRVLDAATKGVAVKYQNSPESQIFSKRKELYGLYQAKQAINKHDQVYMVEGYTDVISMHQCGIENVVANSGTALTPEQITLLHRFTNNITLLYDGDDAGIHAAQRGTDMLLAANMNVKILLLPDGDDPDSFARKHTADEYRQYIEENQVDFITFKTSLLLEQAKGDPVKLSQLVNEIIVSIAVIPNEITRMLYLRQAAQMMQMDENIIYRAVQQQMSKNREDEYKRRNARTAYPNLPDGWEAENTQKAPSEPEQAHAPEVPVSQPSSLNPHPSSLNQTSGFDKLELLLAQLIVQHGEKVICTAENEHGEEVPLTVVEFVFYSLTQDGLTVKNTIAKRIMDLALEHVKDDGFKAERFFLENEDQVLASTAFSLITEKEELSRIHNESKHEENIMERTSHLLADIKLAVIQSEIKQVMADMKNPAATKERDHDLLTRFKDLKTIESRLAKKCGDKVL